MASFSITTLDWLERPPSGFRGRLRELTERDEDSAAYVTELLALARCALDNSQLAQLSRVLDKVRASPDARIGGELTPLRLALLVDGTGDYLAPAIRATGLRHGLMIDTYAPDYGQALAEVVGAGAGESGLKAFRPDVALIASDYRSLGLAAPYMEADRAKAAVGAAVSRLTLLIDTLAGAGITPVIQTVAAPADLWCGHLDAAIPGSPTAQVAAVNAALRDFAKRHGAPVLDVDQLAAAVGRERWFDHTYWHRAKIPFALDMTPLWADHLSRLLGALRGKARKCLVLDLDNTCWGGVIGDDGLEGIQLGQGSADGEAFLAVQAYALSLRARGVVLAVVSKNEDDAARLPFRQHPEMLLKEDDIAVFLADWNDKATNIQHVAQRLNIGLDALAFLDDNPAERARVRQMLPQVAVPELPDDPSLYPTVLAQSGLFETLALSADDARRAEQYRQNAARSVALEKIGDYDAYLASMEMVCDLSPFDAVGRARIAQLVNKSNQFNLTTRRYSETDIAAFEADPDIFDLQARLTDTFGDNGMISVVIFRKGADDQAGDWICDTWLMSCRVLGRRVDEAVLVAVVEAARAEGARRLVGDYLPSAKNRMVAGHFEKLGFVPAGPIGEDGARWTLDLSGWRAPELPMKLTGARAPASRG